jgi:hypothetical protein
MGHKLANHSRYDENENDGPFRQGFAQKVGNPPTAVGGYFSSFLQTKTGDPGIPPTAVGGLFNFWLVRI